MSQLSLWAVSELKRTFQTASYAGFQQITAYNVLNEIDLDLSPADVERIKTTKQVPDGAVKIAQTILSNPPKEKVWVTHGLVIAALAHELGIPPEEVFIPKMGSVTKLTLR